LGSTVLVEEVLDELDVGGLGLLFAFSLLVVPGGPLGFGLQLHGPWCRLVAITHSGLLVETVEAQFLVVGDLLESLLFS
jgi:hypothetical protein